MTKKDPWPATPQTVEEYVAHLFNRKCSPSTITVYLSAVARRHLSQQLTDPTTNPRLKQIVEGARRLSSRKPDQRLPITPDLLRRLSSRLHLAAPTFYDQHMVWAAFTMAQHFLLRASELTSPSPTTFEASATLLLQDVRWDTITLHLTIKRSKTDQHQNGITLSLTSVAAPAVHSACVTYGQQRQQQQPADLPFLIFGSGRYLTRTDLSQALKRTLPEGEDSRRYSSHSFRIGGATAAATGGCSPEAIRKLGRWKSSAFKRFIRPQCLRVP
ncbi:uncharacterized protein LOC129586035 [Paramacrobiotus metropolitanus]|uniref:uncharacterized protein LOC129586035 n=1 Tax=Paramacrobiotus metropolitanus TaxID=2943436 RepID=UPI002445D1E2|nr:uncharacterized protein LOC129586035 [Paramacrobiotus metropolitanus]